MQEKNLFLMSQTTNKQHKSTQRNLRGKAIFQGPHNSSYYPTLIAICLIILVGVISYSNTFHGPFVFDDAQNIVELKGIHLDSLATGELALLWETIVDTGRPVAMLSLALNYYFGKLNTFGYHLVNLLIHLLSAASVYLLIKLTLSLPSLKERYGKYAYEAALFTSLIFVVHPIQTQAVSYIVQRMASMVALFFILSIYCYARARLSADKTRTLFFAASIIMALLALGSKQNAITLPFFILLYEYYFFQKGELGSTKKRWLYIIVGAVLLATVIAGIYADFDFMHWLKEGYKQRHFTAAQRMLTQPRVIIFYLSLLLAPLPSRLNLDHHFPLSYSLLNPPATLLAIAFIVGLIASSIYIAKKRPLVSFCLIWFWANLVIESSFLPLEMVFEHRLYLPSVGLFLLFSLCLIKIIDKLKTQDPLKEYIKFGLLIALVIPLSAMTYQRNKIWQDRVLLWEDAYSKSPNKTRSNYNLGHVYADSGRLDEAIAKYKHTIKLDPGYNNAHNNLANIYVQQGKLDQAIAEHLEEIKHNPDNAKAYSNLGNTYLDKGFHDKAKNAYQKAIQLDPKLSAAYYGLAGYYEEVGNYEQAINNYQKTIEISPNFAEAFYGLGGIYEKQQNIAKAIQLYEQAIKLKPSLVSPYMKLGTIYTHMKYYKRAIAVFEQVLQLDPNNSDGHYNLGISYILNGQPQLAEREYLLTIKLNPDHPMAHKELGIIYLKEGKLSKSLFHFEKSLKLEPQQPQADLIKKTIAQLKEK